MNEDRTKWGKRERRGFVQRRQGIKGSGGQAESAGIIQNPEGPWLAGST